MSKSLVIVESPTKAKTIAKILGSDFQVEASFGHVRDLPKSKLGVDVENDFAPQYVIPTKSRKQVTKLKKLAEGAAKIYLATDEDREGEAIGWHIQTVLNAPDDKVTRVAFHEITPEAIKEAFAGGREIDRNLVDAQQARRILDRLVGYKLSPLLWKKLFRRLSAGRVQSVALRVLVEREREIEAFKPEEYWTIEVKFKTDAGEEFVAQVIPEEGMAATIREGGMAQKITEEIKTAGAHKVLKLVESQRRRNPLPPFTTSTLQQQAGISLGFSVKKTMLLAQQLYEGVDIDGSGPIGVITYMRTDSTNLAKSAVEVARKYVTDSFGKEYLPDAPIIYQTKSKGAQEAHEAIRPTRVDLTPDQISSHLTPDQSKLYRLIWQRMISCQMKPAVMKTVEVTTESGRVLAKANGAVVEFLGFAKALDKWPFKENRLPDLKEGQVLRLEDVEPNQHFTEPPARYTEASLVKQLEKMGIGRPSTYAPTITTLGTRGYIIKEKKALVPQHIGMLVNDFLVKHFPDIVDYNFTAKMEEDLDRIADGGVEWVPVIREFYEPFIANIMEKEKEVEKEKPADKPTDQKCPNCGNQLLIKTGRFGEFLACSNFPECRYTQTLGDDGKVADEVTDKTCEKCGGMMVKKTGRFGPFLGCSNYPKCKNIISLDTTSSVKVKCPKCEAGMLTGKRTKRGKIFYGCDQYPKCDFAVWDEPVDHLCPTCGKFMTKPAKKGYPVCTECGFEEKS
jgi:DNA topoisomerase I